MKRILAVILVIIMLAFTVSCGEGEINTSELITHTLNGVTFRLPRYMRLSAADGYDAAFDNMSIFLSVKAIDEEQYESLGLKVEDGRDKYFDALMKRSGFDRSRVFYEKNEEKKLVSFRYSYDETPDDTSDSSLFYYVILAGDTDNLWYFEICCMESDSDANIDTFNMWRNNIEVTEKKK